MDQRADQGVGQWGSRPRSRYDPGALIGSDGSHDWCPIQEGIGSPPQSLAFSPFLGVLIGLEGIWPNGVVLEQ